MYVSRTKFNYKITTNTAIITDTLSVNSRNRMVFAAHRTDSFKDKLDDNDIKIIFVPASCTRELKPLGVAGNDEFKRKIKTINTFTVFISFLFFISIYCNFHTIFYMNTNE
jgi:hypothetical protein